MPIASTSLVPTTSLVGEFAAYIFDVATVGVRGVNQIVGVHVRRA